MSHPSHLKIQTSNGNMKQLEFPKEVYVEIKGSLKEDTVKNLKIKYKQQLPKKKIYKQQVFKEL